MPLTARSGRHHVEAILREKNISYEPKNLDKIMIRFKEMADNIEQVYDDVLVMAVRGDKKIPDYYKLISFKPWFDGKGYAKIQIAVERKKVTVTANGNGMINATENAINKITGTSLTIMDYSSRALTKGGESKGIESITVRNNKYIVRGVGISEDTVYGAAKALVDANNRMRYVLKNK